MSESRGWRIASASVLGTSHARLGTPCQDSHVIKLFTDKDGEDVLVVVVSDGAGSASKAEIGSWLTCSTVAEAAEVYLLDGGKVREVGLDIAQSWISMVQQAVGFRAEDYGDVPRDYACTMLVAVVGSDAAAIMQVGDGATVVSDDDNGWCWVHWPQHGEFANTTNFVTEPRAEEKLAFDLCQCRIEEIAVFSDGIERLVLHEATKTVFASFFDQMFPAVRALQHEGWDASLSEILRSYLDSETINERTDDDKTLVLATRRSPLPAESGSPSPEETAKGE
jgi:hypothetical protein